MKAKETKWFCLVSNEGVCKHKHTNKSICLQRGANGFLRAKNCALSGNFELYGVLRRSGYHKRSKNQKKPNGFVWFQMQAFETFCKQKNLIMIMIMKMKKKMKMLL